MNMNVNNMLLTTVCRQEACTEHGCCIDCRINHKGRNHVATNTHQGELCSDDSWLITTMQVPTVTP